MRWTVPREARFLLREWGVATTLCRYCQLTDDQVRPKNTDFEIPPFSVHPPSPLHSLPDHVRPDHVRPDHVRPDQLLLLADQSVEDHVRPSHPLPDQVQPNQSPPTHESRLALALDHVAGSQIWPNMSCSPIRGVPSSSVTLSLPREAWREPMPVAGLKV